MRVMTWNVWWRFGGAWQERATGIAATLEQAKPDVVGLVEAWADDDTTQPRRLADRLGMAAAAFAPTSLPPVPDPPEEPTQAGIEMGVGLLSSWSILATEIHRLPSAQRPGPPPSALSNTRGARCT
ncbi:endonuclease/exonuclease/phosphatase family protein [Plantactinospora sp. KLBMP9567]|uniref:endonuclease/exonuclease/phosphatase family protein n=1 Tax=Plantactinospora sp. KLBMP9567 TaxID=3085900 RepID=UPI0029829A4D|nr:endonuclease/exonuclease/phosphatase family protein [Plantactinospora sp. KLBMP9567]MDW5328875.1 endonuclease/exonuclease/phosphatase family protein [Plantactinospora sp. KLBMP9567]